MEVWLGLGFGCGAGPCPCGCHPPPLPPACHEGKVPPAWGCQAPVCWGDGGGLDGEPIGGKEGAVPVGVVGLLEKPEPPDQKDRDYGMRGSSKNTKNLGTFPASHLQGFPPGCQYQRMGPECLAWFGGWGCCGLSQWDW